MLKSTLLYLMLSYGVATRTNPCKKDTFWTELLAKRTSQKLEALSPFCSTLSIIPSACPCLFCNIVSDSPSASPVQLSPQILIFEIEILWRRTRGLWTLWVFDFQYNVMAYSHIECRMQTRDMAVHFHQSLPQNNWSKLITLILEIFT